MEVVHLFLDEGEVGGEGVGCFWKLFLEIGVSKKIFDTPKRQE